MAPVTHIVLLEFKPEVTKAQRDEFSAELLDLKNKCIHPKTNQSYILRSSGGTDNSIEGLQHGISHAFVVEFASAEDREYYVKQDPAHLDYVKKLFPSLAKPYVVDFTPESESRAFTLRTRLLSRRNKAQFDPLHNAPFFKVYLIIEVDDDVAENFSLFVEITIDQQGYISYVEAADPGSMHLVLVDTRHLEEVRSPWNNKRQLG